MVGKALTDELSCMGTGLLQDNYGTLRTIHVIGKDINYSRTSMA